MYEIDLYTNDWIRFDYARNEEELIMKLDILHQRRPGQLMRILKEDNLLCFLDGYEYQYNWFKEKLESDKTKVKRR